jgi:hypothetical protein
VDEEDIKQTFRVHKDLICQYSPFFKAAFDGTFEESQTQTMRMEDVDTDLFGILVHWLYTKEIPSERSFVPSRILVIDGTAGKVIYGFRHESDVADSSMALLTLQEANKWKDLKELVLLAKIWMLADRCLMPRLQNNSMKLLHAEIGKADPRTVNRFADYCYQTTNQTPLQTLAIQRLAITLNTAPPNILKPNALIVDLTRHMATRVPLHYLAISKVEDFYVEEPKEK